MLGDKYKNHFIFVQKNENESLNLYYKRRTFINKYIHLFKYDEIVLISNYYVNIFFKNMKYDQFIHDKLDEIMH